MANLEIENKKKQLQPQKQPLQPGMLMYESGIIYFSDHFDSSTTKPVINTIIEKIFCHNVKDQKKSH